ncbi:MAG: amino acid permease [Acidimicrobiales bacterium]
MQRPEQSTELAAGGCDRTPTQTTAPQTTAPQTVPVPGSRRFVPEALSSPDAVALPETLRYRLKNALLGPPLATERQAVERLGKLAGLGVLAPDMISSSAYGTEEMLTQLVPWFGLAAFSLVVPVTLIILGVLLFVTLSYFEVIKAYTRAGGSYVVARDNFGPRVAQVAAVALLIDYTVTVAVQCTAGTDALTSLIPRLTPYTVPVTVTVIVILCYGNLRGIREGAKFFAVPTYLFIFGLGSAVVVGVVREVLGDAPARITHHSGMLGFGNHSGLIAFAAITVMLKSFANGGSSLTGLEAISNGIGAFKRPEARNGRITLVIMSSVLGFLVLGVSLLAHWSHAVPYSVGSPTVVAQIAGWVYGTHGPGVILRDFVVISTVLILFTGGNTSFNGFPYLASFVAEDSFLPRQLTRRGHRLAFSNGIVVLAVVAIALVVGTDANLTSLVALYAIGVFTGFTMAGAGMVKHHRTLREPGWAYRQLINGFAALLSAAVVVIFAVFKFTEGAWLVVVVGPLLYMLLVRLNRQYAGEAKELEVEAAQACEEPVLRRHVVLVLVGRLDLATARAVQYARALTPDELRAVHFAVDPRDAADLEADWSRLGLSLLPLDIIDCPDRRLARATLELAAQTLAGGNTELSILLPRRGFAAGWRRLLHDRSADRIAAAVAQLPHANATIVPFQLSGSRPARHFRKPAPEGSGARRMRSDVCMGDELAPKMSGTTPIGEATWRSRVRVAGRVRSIRVPTRTATANLECTLADPTGAILLVFQGRRHIPGIHQGVRLVAQGTVGAWEGRLAILNPDYELIAGPDTAEVEPQA